MQEVWPSATVADELWRHRIYEEQIMPYKILKTETANECSTKKYLWQISF